MNFVHNSRLLENYCKVNQKYFTKSHPPYPNYFISYFGLGNKSEFDSMGFTYGLDWPFNQALILFELLEKRETLPLALLGFNDYNDYYEVAQLRGARGINKGQLDKILWECALLDSIKDFAIDNNVEEIKMVSSQLVKGMPCRPDLILKRYDKIPKSQGFRFDRVSRFHILNLKGIYEELVEDLEEFGCDDIDEVLAMEGLRLF